MSVQNVPQATSPLVERVASEVRAEMARQRRSGRQLAVALGLSPAAVSRRITGELPFDVRELEQVAGFLRVPVGQLLGLAAGQPTVPNVAPRRLHAVPTIPATRQPADVTRRSHLQHPILTVVQQA